MKMQLGVAKRFIQERMHPSLTDLIANRFSNSKIPDTAKALEE
jgi:hypothetical protein